jgi:hypothetical protein
MTKQFKDPIYEYVNIDGDVVNKIIDTPTFQRLKDIRQTSYAPLYPAAYHNRFVHSLGVYYLGKIAFSAIKSQLQEYGKGTGVEANLDRIQQLFELACLLHDVGHAPFSHTGEAFYIDETGTLYQSLKDCVEEDSFSADFDTLGTNKPAPHECMSCVVGIKTFFYLFKDAQERALFARCIVGMSIRLQEKEPKPNNKMSQEEKKALNKKRKEFKARRREVELYNCVISLLNSSIIDVDRLDYVIRDATTIGFKNAQIDYMRLLNGMRIVESDGHFCIGYHKSALSVIESTVYAHDAEKKWVQSHPAILYEMETIKSAMSELTNKFTTDTDLNPLFCYEAITEEGKTLKLSTPLFSGKGKKLEASDKLWSVQAKALDKKNQLFADRSGVNANLEIEREYPIALLADEDFLHLMKLFCKDSLGYEYFARDKRRSAVWKSEAEFRALFQKRIGDTTDSIVGLEKDFEELAKYCQDKTGTPIVNDVVFEILDQEDADAKKALDDGEIDKDDYDDIISGDGTKRHWAKILIGLAEKLNLEHDFMIIFQKKFSSSFKATVGDIPIYFPNVEGGVVPLGKVVTTLSPTAERKSNFFHIFFKPIGEVNDKRKKTIVNTIAKELIRGIE